MKRSYMPLLCLSVLLISLVGADAKVYIDITSPARKQFPIAIYDFSDDEIGKKITGTIRDDLEFTGLFYFVDKSAFIEDKADDFSPKNWSPIGVEAVLKGDVGFTDKLNVMVRFYDAVDSKVIIYKQYNSDRKSFRALAHTIADDIYYALTGEKGIFRTRIAFVADTGKSKDLSVIDYDGKRSYRAGFGKSLMLSPHVSGDGSKIIASASDGGQWSIYLIDFKSLLSGKIFSSNGLNIAGNFSPEGDFFVFSSSKGGYPDLYLYNLSSGGTKRLTSSLWIDISPALSPDGEKIAFVSNRSGNPHIYLMDMNGYNIRRVTFEGKYNTSPSWSPTGDMIVFSGMVEGKNQIFTVRPDGTDMKRLTDAGNNEDPVFSPGGRFIAFTSDRDGYKGIYTMRRGGENQKRVTPEGYRAFGPEWLPN